MVGGKGFESEGFKGREPVDSGLNRLVFERLNGYVFIGRLSY